jgi:hypothetical protein
VKTANCLHCTKEYTTRKLTQKFCAKSCANSAKKGITCSPATQFKKGSVPVNKKESIKKVCKCGKEFEVKPSEDRIKSCSQSCAKKGLPSPNKGKKASEETRKKQRDSKLGIRGEAHWNYRGYKNKNERKIAIAQDEYKQWRLAIFKRDEYTCQICNIKGGTLQADHIVPWCINKELRYDINNGRTLCIECHRKTPTYGVKAIKYKEIKNER